MVSLAYNPALATSLTVLYIGLSAGTVYYCVKATRCDPSDPTIALQKEAEARGEVFDATDYDFECDICATAVLSSSKHCGSCNRCVSGFDHHCRWLNNCVGTANYKLFFRLVVVVFVMSLLHNVANLLVLVHLFREHQPLVDSHNLFYKRVFIVEFQIAIIVAMVFNFAAFLFLGHLIAFHLMLQKRQMTTYEYIRWK